MDVSSPRDTNSPIVSHTNGSHKVSRNYLNVISQLQFGVIPKQKEDREKLLSAATVPVTPVPAPTKTKWFRQDTEKKANAAAEKEEKKRNKAAAKAAKSAPPTGKLLASFKQSDKSCVPLFLEKCVHFIEREGVDSEGIYRVPGNRTHVDLLYQKFDEEDNVDIEKLDIPVNAVATALKDFFSKHLPPLFEPELMNELEVLYEDNHCIAVLNQKFCHGIASRANGIGDFYCVYKLQNPYGL